MAYTLDTLGIYGMSPISFETEAECIQHGNRLLIQDSRYKYFCTEIRR